MGGACASAMAIQQATQPAPPPPTGGTKRAIPVENVVPKGAAEFKGKVITLEVIEALDVRRSDGGWRTRLAVRYKNVRGERLRCRLEVSFDGKQFDAIEFIDLPAGETDLTVISQSGGDGKRASQLSKFTAEASSIRIGD